MNKMALTTRYNNVFLVVNTCDYHVDELFWFSTINTFW